MLFALHANIHVLQVVFSILAIGAGLGVAQFLNNRQNQKIAARKRAETYAKLMKEVEAPEEVCDYFTSEAIDDPFGKLIAEHKMDEAAKNPDKVKARLRHSAEVLLRKEALTPAGRRRLEHDADVYLHRHPDDESAELVKTLKGLVSDLKETASVPDGKGGTTTVPVQEIHNHTHYHGEKPADAPQAQAAA